MMNERFLVQGMSCGHCVATIQKALGSTPGVLRVDVNLEKKEVSVEFDEGKVTVSGISAKIKEIGFEVIGG